MILMLRFFMVVLQDSFKGKHFTYRIEPLKPVPGNSLLLWRRLTQGVHLPGLFLERLMLCKCS